MSSTTTEGFGPRIIASARCPDERRSSKKPVRSGRSFGQRLSCGGLTQCFLLLPAVGEMTSSQPHYPDSRNRLVYHRSDRTSRRHRSEQIGRPYHLSVQYFSNTSLLT